jgi:hypothetical protein
MSALKAFPILMQRGMIVKDFECLGTAESDRRPTLFVYFSADFLPMLPGSLVSTAKYRELIRAPEALHFLLGPGGL